MTEERPFAWEIRKIPVALVVPGDNDRTTFEPQALQDLARSIHRDGLIQPITVRAIFDCPAGHLSSEVGFTYPNGHDIRAHGTYWCDECERLYSSDWDLSHYQIVAGERRFRAVSELLKWETIPALVRQLNDEEAAGIMLAENVHREELSPIEEAKAYAKRMDQHGWSASETGRRAKVSEGRVRSRLKLLTLAPDIQQLVEKGQMPIGFGEELARLDEAHQRFVATWLSKQRSRPTKQTFTAYVGKVYEQQAQTSIFDMGLILQAGVAEAIEGTKDGRLWQVLPGIETLPDLPYKQGSMGNVLDQYVVRLLDEGHMKEAAIVIDTWRKLQRANFAVMPPLDSLALQRLSVGQ